MMDNFKIFVGAHGAATVVFLFTDDVNFTDVKRISCTDNGTDVEVVFNVFDGDFKASTFSTKLIKNLLV